MIEVQPLPLPCIVCGMRPSPAFANANVGNRWQPSGATMFDAGCGHYGSTVWDTMSPYRSLTINVCDACLIANSSRVAVVHTEHRAPESKYVPWKPEADT